MEKRLNLLLSCFFVLILSVSCAFVTPLPQRLSDVVEYAENNQAISDEEWEYVKEDYYLLTDEFRANLSTFTDEEKQDVYELMGKMNGIIAKREANKIMNGLNELSNSLPSIIEGFVQGFTGENN